MNATIKAVLQVGSEPTADDELGRLGSIVTIECGGHPVDVWVTSERQVATVLAESNPVLLRNTLVLRQPRLSAILPTFSDIEAENQDIFELFSGAQSNNPNDYLQDTIQSGAGQGDVALPDLDAYAEVRGWDVWLFDDSASRRRSCTILSAEYYKSFFDLSDRLFPSGAYLAIGTAMLVRNFVRHDMWAGLQKAKELSGDLWDFRRNRTTFVAGGDGRLFGPK